LSLGTGDGKRMAQPPRGLDSEAGSGPMFDDGASSYGLHGLDDSVDGVYVLGERPRQTRPGSSLSCRSCNDFGGVSSCLHFICMRVPPPSPPFRALPCPTRTCCPSCVSPSPSLTELSRAVYAEDVQTSFQPGHVPRTHHRIPVLPAAAEVSHPTWHVV